MNRLQMRQSPTPCLQVHVYDRIVDAGNPGVERADGSYIKAWCAFFYPKNHAAQARGTTGHIMC